MYVIATLYTQHQTILLLCSLQERNGGDPIPMVVRSCIEYLEKEGLNVEGIFRRTTAQSMVKRAKVQLNEGIKIIYNTNCIQYKLYMQLYI